MSAEQIKSLYADRIMAVMHRIAGALREEGFVVEGPDYFDADEYRWSVLVHLDGDVDAVDEGDVDIAFKIAESEEYDGSQGGVTFAVDIVEVSGRILGGLTPFNFTDRCWVSRNDPEAVEERFRILEDADEGGVVWLLIDHKGL
jgi:hypothetical protein